MVGNEKSDKDWQLEIMMEKIRAKAGQHKSLGDLAKNVRMSMLDKRYGLDSVEKSQHQKCLDRLQQFINVTSLQSMIERLECLTRQLGLKFMVGPSGVELFISSDMFYLEIVLEPNGNVKDVKVHHESKLEQQSCSELVTCLAKGDFSDFTAQLEGFTAIYQLNAEKKTKCKAFTALQSLESDLNTLAQLQSFMKEPFNLIHKSPVGVLQRRRGGHPMKLTYFVSPYELINTNSGELDPINIEAIINRKLGNSVTVCIEGSATHKLQTTTLITVNRNVNGKSTPSFPPLNSQNSAAIMACFVLQLNEPMPIFTNLIHRIQQITEIDCGDYLQSNPQSILSLIVNRCSNGTIKIENTNGLFVTLPEQTHCYFLTENKNMEACLIGSIPFTHPAHVSQILTVLRQQILFNTLISSCVRPKSYQDFENMIVVEVNALSSTNLSLTLEHPYEDTMATAEFDLNELSNLICTVRCPIGGAPMSPPPSTTLINSIPNTLDCLASDICTKILNRTLSVPITVRAMVRQWAKASTIKRLHYVNGQQDENYNNLNPSHTNRKLDGAGRVTPNSGTTEFGDFKTDGSSNQNLYNSLDQSAAIPSGVVEHFSPIMSNTELTHLLSSGGASDGTSKLQCSEDSNSTSSTNSSDSNCTDEEDDDDDDDGTPVSSCLGFQSSDLELSTLDPVELLHNDGRGGSSTMEFDVEDMLEASVVDTTNTNISITPISFKFHQNVEKKSAIEIIPLSGTSNSCLTSNMVPINSSLTITPLTNRRSSQSETRRTIPIASSNPLKKQQYQQQRPLLEDNSVVTIERKRKRTKRDDDPLNEPVSISIKPSSRNNSPKMCFNNSPLGGGKPSMSTLKSATTLDKDKQSCVKKVKLIEQDELLGDCNNTIIVPSSPNQSLVITDLRSTTGSNNNSNNTNGTRNRKGSLSAIVDKLKSAQNDTIIYEKTDNITGGSEIVSLGDGTVLLTGKNSSEYMVKPSSDGMKITINKTRGKEVKSSTKTGLKPGVNSGPASKKISQLIGGGGGGQKPLLNNSGKKPVFQQQKFPSGGHHPANNNNKAMNFKNFTRIVPIKQQQQQPQQQQQQRVQNVGPLHRNDDKTSSVFSTVQSSSIIDGLVNNRQFDKNFHIPKLSARQLVDNKSIGLDRDDLVLMDSLTVLPQYKINYSVKHLGASSTTTTTPTVGNVKMPSSSGTSRGEQSTTSTASILDLNMVKVPIKERHPHHHHHHSQQQQHHHHHHHHHSDWTMNDFDIDSNDKPLLVKSTPSSATTPHSISPCITDDELMDEALIGLDK